MSYSEIQVSLPRRHEGMPKVYQVENHPLLDGIAHVGKVYVGYMRTDKWSVKDCLVLEKGLACPKGDVAEWVAQGRIAVSLAIDWTSQRSRTIATHTWRLPLSERPQRVE
jgi:hypothetical protein